MANEARLALEEFVRLQSAGDWAELRSISVDTDYPFLRSTSDLEEERIKKHSELPFANLHAAEAALRRKELERLAWRKACLAAEGGDWECHARPENELNWRVIPARLLARAVPNLGAGSLLLLGDMFEDVEFVRSSPIEADEKALEVIKQYCHAHDPGAHRIKDVRREVEDRASLQMSLGYVRQLMKRAGIDERWFAPGRRSARCAACNR